MGKTIFVTVGTTKFDKLIKTVTEEKILKLFKNHGYEKLILQIGHGSFEPVKSDIISIEYYRLKDSIRQDILNSDLVISHCGAGSCLEILGMKKKMIAVVNEDLMDNHQIELAEKLADMNLCYFSNCKELYTTSIDVLGKLEKLNQFEDGDTNLFSRYLNKACGFS